MASLGSGSTVAALLLAGLAGAAALAFADGDGRVLDARLHHLGDDRVEWPDVSSEPEGDRLDLTFTSTATGREGVLFLFSRHVDHEWTVRVNGESIGTLPRGDAPVQRPYPIPAGVLVDENVLTISSSSKGDDVIVGDVHLHERSLREVLRLGDVRLEIEDGDTGEPLPVRVTIVDADGRRVETYRADANRTAVRAGIVYTKDGRVDVEVPAGEYTVYATRGMEWGLGKKRLLVRHDRETSATLELHREVDTTGYVAADTHVHTFTHSGHGDSTVEERMITLAGEGVELAIATDHNHNVDYRPAQRALGVEPFFTAVTGNEVTTDVGHFNAFPLDPNDDVPSHKIHDWIQLVDGIRAKGARVVILNHPRWPKVETGPFGKYGLDHDTGSFADGRVLPVDAIEVVNATTFVEDPLLLVRDWFALLNRGMPITAVASSDSHTVGDPVGQGRTYVRSSTDDPASIDVDEACDAFLRGDTTIAHGIFVEAVVDGRHGPGSRVTVGGGTIALDLRVAAPSWVRPRTALVYRNGVEVARRDVAADGSTPTDSTLTVELERPPHDAYVVCVVVGEGITAPFWPTLNPYTLGATNPIYLDADGDGRFESPREIAMRRLASGDSLGSLFRTADAAVRRQAIDVAAADEARRTELEALVGADGFPDDLRLFAARRIAR